MDIVAHELGSPLVGTGVAECVLALLRNVGHVLEVVRVGRAEHVACATACIVRSLGCNEEVWLDVVAHVERNLLCARLRLVEAAQRCLIQRVVHLVRQL